MTVDTLVSKTAYADTIERRRPGRVSYENPVLINLLRGVEQNVLAPESVDDVSGLTETPAPAAELPVCDEPVIERLRFGILVQIGVSLVLWGLIAETFMLVRGAFVS